MSTTEDIEQIIKIEDLNTPTTPRVKDPKKVKAGKALAKINAEARKAAENAENAEVEENEEISTPIGIFNIFYNGILSAAGFIGAGFTLYHGWKFFETSFKKVEKLTSVTPKVETKKSLRKTIDF